MATWEDGPEYAPLERPDSFAEPPAVPLDDAPVEVRLAAGRPVERPRFDQPPVPVAPLAELVPTPAYVRDPHLAFDVVGASLTPDPTWGPTTWDPQAPFSQGPATPSSSPSVTPFPSASFPVAQAGPTAAPVAQAAPVPSTHPPAYPAQNGYPAPGTPGWFAPPPTYGEQVPPRGRVDAKQVVQAATPGLCICLAVGGLIYVLAPVVVGLAVFLSARVTVAQRPVRIAFRAAAGLVLLIGIVAALGPSGDGVGWWNFLGLWSLVICWTLLVVLLALVHRGLSRPGATPPPPTRSTWG